MDGLCRVIGAACPIRLQGKTWILQPLRLKDWGLLENWLLFNRPTNPLRDLGRATAALHDAEQYELAKHLEATTTNDLRKTRGLRTIGPDELIGFLNTSVGLIMSIWLGLLHYQDFANLEQVEKVLTPLSSGELAEIVRLRDQIAGIDLLANADWPDPWAGIRKEKLAKRKQLANKQPSNWRKNIYLWGMNFGFPRSEIAEWTLYEVQIYNSNPEHLGIRTDEQGMSAHGSRR